ncbi:type VI secretion system Vgr family protein [Caballeronia sp. SL2Y3]|uniref:type VI secretion system Vgr family protein n=1 Tax=Caballeronia sp. SL2Y3 TaxID=2878151 RepID=UPI001FD24234|nr:type VI secretion system tip protein TssI/VgrG [Caballeronia sp. SL2Y3]
MPRQSDLRFTFGTASGLTLDVRSFDLVEGLSEPFELDLELASHDPAVDFGDVLDQGALLTIWRDDVPVRYVHGIVSAFEQGETGFRRTVYHATVTPALARADLRSDWRVFQQKSIPQILQTLMTEQGITDYEQMAFSTHLPREYCVQAGESTLEWVQRIGAEEGFYYAFQFSANGHRLIHGDKLIVHGAIAGGPVSYNPNPGGDAPEPGLRSFRYAERVRTARQAQRDYTFKNPRYGQQHSQDGANVDHQGRDYERYGYPGRYKEDAAGVPFTQTRLLALRRDAQIAIAEGDDARLVPGLRFDLVDHPREEWNRGWRPVRIMHRGTQHVSQQEESADAQQGTHYGYTAELVPDDVEWKAPLPPKPRIDGPLIATVTGPAGEEIYCDEFGRVKICFPWQRNDPPDEQSSCWVRVAQNWAGATWGHMAIPRIGQEVIVAFLDGDPDQPIIIGRTYHAENLPPYELPRHKTRMTIKSQTHKGDGFNELRFEDEKDQEEIYVHAQKDQNIHVNHDETIFVGNDRSENVERDETIGIGHDRSETVGNDEEVSVGHNRTHRVGQDATLMIERNHTLTIGKNRVETIGNDRTDKITANHTTEVGGHVEQTVQGHHKLSVGQSIERQTQMYQLQASDRAVIQGPGGTITIDGSGITIKGPQIRLEGAVTVSTGSGNGLSFNGSVMEGAADCVEKNR